MSKKPETDSRSDAAGITGKLTTKQWEAICRRCGECCFEKTIDSKGHVWTTSVPCRFLDVHSRNCQIYQQRLQAEEDCIKLTPDILPQLDWLPLNCAYRQLLSTN